MRRWHHNRATHFTWWDRLMGTLHPDYDGELRANILPISTHLMEKPETLDDAKAEPRLSRSRAEIDGGGAVPPRREAIWRPRRAVSLGAPAKIRPPDKNF